MNNPKPQIRFGVLCHGTSFPRWQAQTLKKLWERQQVLPSLLITVPKQRESSGGKTHSASLLWTLYAAHYVRKKAKAYRIEDLSQLLADVPRLAAGSASNEGRVIEFSQQEIQAVLDRQLDFILHFGPGRPAAQLLSAARFGVWAFRHTDGQQFSGIPAGFWEIYRGELVTVGVLEKLTTAPDQPVILKTGFFKTKVRYTANLDQVLLGSAHWPAELCVDIRYQRHACFEQLPVSSDASSYRLPGNGQVLAFFGKVLAKYAKKAVRSLFYTDYWNIGIASVPIQSFLNPDPLPPVEWFAKLPKEKFIADPFALTNGNKIHIVYEDFLFREGLGTIGTIEFGDKGFSNEVVRIKEPFHLSYPFTFEYENEVYAIPESYQAGQVRLYKALDFPRRWAFDRVLIDGYAGVDNTLFAHEGYWYLFSTDMNDGVHHNLKIHYTQDLFGHWIPHPKNPVKTDIRSARPAGTIFEYEGDLFRPAMDYSEKVEGRIIINKMITLSPTDFAETAHCTVNPFPNTVFSDKVHTLCAAGDYTIVDGAQELFVLRNIHAFRYKLGHLRNKLVKQLRFFLI